MKNSTQHIKQLALITLAASALTLICSSPERSRAAVTPADGENTFKATCSICHGPDGGGKTAMGEKLGIRDLRSPEVQRQSDAQIFETIARGKDKMPAWEKKLGREKITQLVAYIRALGKKS
jgi:mono/diheme cytochrome c family protein